MAASFISTFTKGLCRGADVNCYRQAAGCSEALGDEKASASELADNECCIGDEDAVDILMSLRDGGMQVGLPSDAVAVCVAQIVITSAAWRCTCVPAHCSVISREASGKKPHHFMPP